LISIEYGKHKPNFFKHALSHTHTHARAHTHTHTHSHTHFIIFAPDIRGLRVPITMKP